MKFIDEYRDKALVKELAENLKSISKKEISLMEVCGGHTMAIHKFGIPSILPSNITLTSGPGCPVCVTGRDFIDKAIAYSKKKDVIIATYGDLIRIPGSQSTLDSEKANGASIRMVYSVLEAIEIAKNNPDKKIIFLGIGFETTAPASAAGVLQAEKLNLDNFFLLSSHKIMPPAMEALIDEGVKIDGYLAPGHVSTITGTDMYRNIPLKYKLPVVVSGFEPVDIMQSIYLLVKQIESNKPAVEIQYKRVVKPEGNIKAKKMLEEVFNLEDDWWRGLGILKNSGLQLNKKYHRFDAEKNLPVSIIPSEEPKGCICGLVLKGVKKPTQCKLFANGCNPSNPVGACMVSSEGACHAYFRYHNEK